MRRLPLKFGRVAFKVKATSNMPVFKEENYQKQDGMNTSEGEILQKSTMRRRGSHDRLNKEMG